VCRHRYPKVSRFCRLAPNITLDRAAGSHELAAAGINVRVRQRKSAMSDAAVAQWIAELIPAYSTGDR